MFHFIKYCAVMNYITLDPSHSLELIMLICGISIDYLQFIPTLNMLVLNAVLICDRQAVASYPVNYLHKGADFIVIDLLKPAHLTLDEFASTLKRLQ